VNAPRPRYVFQRLPSRWPRWHLLVLGVAAGAGIALAVAVARAGSQDPPARGFSDDACAVLRTGGALDPAQPVDVLVRHGSNTGFAFRCAALAIPPHYLPPVAVVVVYPP
jgi:hypothetical protein